MKKEINFNNGSKYLGELKNGAMHGKGTLYRFDGGVITGEFKNGGVDGIATWTFPNGDVYEGQFINDYINGKGTYVYKNGDKSVHLLISTIFMFLFTNQYSRKILITNTILISINFLIFLSYISCGSGLSGSVRNLYKIL